MSVVKIITGHDALVARRILAWFARQSIGHLTYVVCVRFISQDKRHYVN